MKHAERCSVHCGTLRSEAMTVTVRAAATPLVEKLARLERSVASGSSSSYCLRLWSEFIRERDRHRCVDCHSRKTLSSHHIARKSFIPDARYLTGNGITLCGECHRGVHVGFNSRPDLALPTDAQGGEKLASMERLYSILTDDAAESGLDVDSFYFLSDEFLGTLKRMQGFQSEIYFPGARVEQAYLILAEVEAGLRRELAAADGIPAPDRPLLPGGLYLVHSQEDGSFESAVIQTYAARTSPSTP